MNLNLRQQVVLFANVLQDELFPVLEAQIGKLDGNAQRLVATLEMIPLARFVPSSRGWIGRPSKDRLAVARAFVAKAVYGLALTRQLLDRLQQDAQLRQICGWSSAEKVPHESTFSRAFAEFAQMELPQFVHEALIRETQGDRLIGHVARDSTAIEARERFPETSDKPSAGEPATPPKAKRKRGSKKGKRGANKRHKGGKPKASLPDDTRLARQREMKLGEMLAELPRECNIGVKTSSKGYTQSWRGYKLHLDVADGQIPISAVLTSASLHDSQVAIPLATMSSQRVTYLYALMDSAYDAGHIREQSRAMGHVPIIDPKQVRQKETPFQPGPSRELSPAEKARYRERTMIERVNGRLKDEFGGREIRVRGAAKVMAHLMFGILALTVDQILKLVR
jgi:hypothetical protein